MKKFLMSILVLSAISAVADSIYLEPKFTVAIESGIFESGLTLQSKTITPVVYKNSLLASGGAITLECKKGKVNLVSIDSFKTKIPVQIADNRQIATNCASLNTAVFWANDEYKIKSDNIVKLDADNLKVIPFTVESNSHVTGVKSDGYITLVSVDKGKYFKKALFFATINGVNYPVQYQQDDQQLTVYSAGMEKITISNANGQIIEVITFPNL